MKQHSHDTRLKNDKISALMNDHAHVMLALTPDKRPQIWVLYRSEPENMLPNLAPIHLWIRRCEMFTSEALAKTTLNRRINNAVQWRHHELFPELQIGTDDRGFRWLLEPAPLYLFVQ